jgi:hypothetical protein
MVQTAKTFRVFVSSTFSDLVEERNALQRNVFPKLRQLCTDRGFRFQAIDLRWGVPEEATLDQQAMQICIKEIERCQHTELRPNFLILLEDRYGTRMAPYEVRASLFEEIRAAAPEEDRALLEYWYQKDENALPPVYLLKPRHDEFIDYTTWRSTENRLLSILRDAVHDTELSDTEHLDFFGSATEQEIYYGALNVPDANEHVMCLFRTIENVPNDRRAEGFIDLTEQGTRDTEAAERLESLKSTLQQHLSKEGLNSNPSTNVKRYEAAWVGGAGADVPVLVNVTFLHQALVTTAISLIVVISVSLDGVWHWRDQWRNYRSTSSAIEHEFFAYETRALPYTKFAENEAGKKAAFTEFVQRVENLISHEVESTLSVMAAVEKQSPEAPQAALKSGQVSSDVQKTLEAIQAAVKSVQAPTDVQKAPEVPQDATLENTSQTE